MTTSDESMTYNQIFSEAVFVLYTVHSRSVYFDPLTRLLHEQVESSRSPCRHQEPLPISFHRRILVLTLLHQRDQRAMHSHSTLVAFSSPLVQTYCQTTPYPQFALSVANKLSPRSGGGGHTVVGSCNNNKGNLFRLNN